MKEIESIEINLSIQNHIDNFEMSQNSKTKSAEKSSSAENTKLETTGPEKSESQGKEKEIAIDDMANLMDKVQKYVESFNTRLSFSVDKESQRPIIYVIDKETNEVIRQIPPKKMLKLIKNLEEIRGLIFQGKV
ncbi:MAG: flagellar protein FlaG [Candidatus Marinimicrobia bacterium]|nr:flagellar protein FlaG [Candidatus Neomarinimicrobiota bacterium]